MFIKKYAGKMRLSCLSWKCKVNELHLTVHELLSRITWIDTSCHELQINLHEGYDGHTIRCPSFIFGVPYIHLIRHPWWHLSRCDLVTDWLWQFTGLSFTTNPPLCYLKEKAVFGGNKKPFGNYPKRFLFLNYWAGVKASKLSSYGFLTNVGYL